MLEFGRCRIGLNLRLRLALHEVWAAVRMLSWSCVPPSLSLLAAPYHPERFRSGGRRGRSQISDIELERFRLGRQQVVAPSNALAEEVVTVGEAQCIG